MPSRRDRRACPARRTAGGTLSQSLLLGAGVSYVANSCCSVPHLVRSASNAAVSYFVRCSLLEVSPVDEDVLLAAVRSQLSDFHKYLRSVRDVRPELIEAL